MTEIIDAKILPGYRTDHSLLNLHLQFGNFKKGTSYWKMNNSLLKDPEYVKIIKDKILENKMLYLRNDQLRERTIHEIPNEEIKFTIDDQLFFETLLCELRGRTISYSSKIKKTENLREQQLLKEINSLEKKLHIDHILLEEKRNQLKKIRDKRMEGVKIRARATWIDEGENNIFFFLHSRK